MGGGVIYKVRLTQDSFGAKWCAITKADPLEVDPTTKWNNITMWYKHGLADVNSSHLYVDVQTELRSFMDKTSKYAPIFFSFRQRNLSKDDRNLLLL
jgi:hypothetical protein